jgi:hypothetical protein
MKEQITHSSAPQKSENPKKPNISTPGFHFDSHSFITFQEVGGRVKDAGQRLGFGLGLAQGFFTLSLSLL